MKDLSSKDLSEKENIGMNEYRCNVLHTLHTLHEKRNVRSIRMRDSIHESVSRYCAFADITIGQFYEESAILFMDLNPVNGTVLNVEHPRKNGVSLKDRMLDMICVGELNDMIPSLRKTRERGYDIHKNLLEGMRKIFDKCYKINEPSDELSRLIEEALSYLE